MCEKVTGRNGLILGVMRITILIFWNHENSKSYGENLIKFSAYVLPWQRSALFECCCSNMTFIALNIPIQENSKQQQNQNSSRPNLSIQRQKRGQAPWRTPEDHPG